jgi:hypothetical protein
MGTGRFSPGAKRPGREADHSPPASAEVKENVDLYIHSPIRLHDVVLNSLGTGTVLPFFTGADTSLPVTLNRKNHILNPNS